MKNFTYYKPTTAEQAVGLLGPQRGPTELLAGGTDLLDLQKEYIAQPEKVVSLTGLGKEFTAIGEIAPPGAFPPSFTVGAGVKLAEIAGHKGIADIYPAVAAAAAQVGGPHIRNTGTLRG